MSKLDPYSTADNGAMQLVRAPKQFDVILTEQPVRIILSELRRDCNRLAGMLPLLPRVRQTPNWPPQGRSTSPYTGSRPHHRSKARPNPIACILSFRWRCAIFDQGEKRHVWRQPSRRCWPNGARMR